MDHIGINDVHNKDSQIPTRKTALQVAVYAPLAAAPVPPDATQTVGSTRSYSGKPTSFVTTKPERCMACSWPASRISAPQKKWRPRGGGRRLKSARILFGSTRCKATS